MWNKRLLCWPGLAKPYTKIANINITLIKNVSGKKEIIIKDYILRNIFSLKNPEGFLKTWLFTSVKPIFIPKEQTSIELMWHIFRKGLWLQKNRMKLFPLQLLYYNSQGKIVSKLFLNRRKLCYHTLLSLTNEMDLSTVKL